MLFSIPQAQQQLGGLSRSKIYEEIGLGRLHAVKIGSRTFVTRDALTEYIAAQTDRQSA